MKNPVSLLRLVSLAEGVSYVVLLGIAMPLKYGANMPGAVKIVGSIHGALFVVFCVALLRAMLGARWPISRAALVFVASLVPLAAFWMDRRIREWQSDYERSRE
jgi:integral membrane protein